MDACDLAQVLIGHLERAEDEQGRRLLALFGFFDLAASYRLLEQLSGKLTAEPRERLLGATLPAMAEAADPDQALVNLIRYGEARFGAQNIKGLAGVAPPSLYKLCVLFGFSPFLADLMIRYPYYLEWLEHEAELDTARATGDYREQLARAAGPFVLGAPKRREAAIRCQRRELLRLGLRRMFDLSGEMEMSRELSDLADAVLEFALAEVLGPLRQRFGEPIEETSPDDAVPPREARFAIVAMGKLGGRELNFSSDIDLIFIYSAEGETTGREDGQARIANHMFFIRVAEGLIEYLMTHTREGYFYRVDTRLRPDGASGPLARSLGAYEIYYETQARAWERLALLKARFVAGEDRLGRAFEAMRAPLVFDPLQGDHIINQIYEVKQMIDEQGHRSGRAEREVKRGHGGIREIEFLVQTLQLLHGGRDARLCATATLDAIEALSGAGFLNPDRADQMVADYLFLRTLEHRLQMAHLRQTHALPDEPRAQDVLARRCGFGGRPDRAPREELLGRWDEVTGRVHAEFIEFFQRDMTETPADEGPKDPAESAARALLSNQPESALLPLLGPFGLAGGGAFKSLRRLAGMGRSTYLTTGGREHFRRLLPNLLRACDANPQPETALAGLESFLQASGATAVYFETFNANPRVFELLMLALGSGDMLARTIVAHPEFVDYLGDAALLNNPADREEMARSLANWTRGERDDDDFCRGLVWFRRFEYLMAALGELAGLLDYRTVCGRLCATADLVIDSVLGRSAAAMGLEPETQGFAVLAMGKMGTRELGYFSDLDLIFAWDERFAGGESTPAEAAAELARRVIVLLTHPSAEGKAYDVDARLRPEGKTAPLAPPIERYMEYYSGRAQVWEFQSAMKLRWIAGDAATGDCLIDVLRQKIIERAGQADLIAEIRPMRERIEASARVPRWAFCDYKKGRGGTVDLEFIAQYLQLTSLAKHPEMIGLAPNEVFKHQTQHGLLQPELGDALGRDYIWMRQLERRARLLQGSERSLVPGGGEKLEALERALRDNLIQEGEPLLEALARVLKRNRSHFEKTFAPNS